MKTTLRCPCLLAACVVVILFGSLVSEVSAQPARPELMSSMGLLAAEAVERIHVNTGARERELTIDAPTAERDDDLCQNNPRCPGGLREGATDQTQSELSIAVDVTGRHVVVGFNDFRGFDRTPISVSGYMFSTDGGRTFQDVGSFQ